MLMCVLLLSIYAVYSAFMSLEPDSALDVVGLLQLKVFYGHTTHVS